MAVFRVEKNANYTTMSNYHLRDKGLSLKAKGLLSFCLSLPDSWDYSVMGLVAVCKEGRDCVMSTLSELEETGYLKRSRLRQSLLKREHQPWKHLCWKSLRRLFLRWRNLRWRSRHK